MIKEIKLFVIICICGMLFLFAVDSSATVIQWSKNLPDFFLRLNFLFISAGIFIFTGLVSGLYSGLVSYALKNIPVRNSEILKLSVSILSGVLFFLFAILVVKPWTKLIRDFLYKICFLASVPVSVYIRFLIIDFQPACMKGFRRVIFLFLLISSFAAIIVLFFADRFLYPRLYGEIHNLIIITILLLSCSFFHLLFSIRNISCQLKEIRFNNIKFLAVASLFFALICYSLAVFSDSHSVKMVVMGRSSIESKLVRFFSSAIDMDTDGFSKILIGGDCNDSDSNISPVAKEIPGNGIDENCNGKEYDPVDFKSSPSHFRGGISYNPPGDVLLLLIDAVRFDLVMEKPSVTPNITRLLKKGFFFSNAISPYPATVHAFFSMEYGRYFSKIKGDETILSQKLEQAGFKEYMFMDGAKFPLEKKFIVNNRELFFTHGRGESDSKFTTEIFLKELSEMNPEERHFYFVYFRDPHDPYEKHQGHGPQGDSMKDRYESEVSYADFQMGLILDQIEKRNLSDRFLIIFLSDHGEEFYDHGGRYHATTTYDELVHIPLVFAGKDILQGTESMPASIVDIFPTIADLYGFEIPETIQGTSLASYIYRKEQGDGSRFVFSEAYPSTLFPHVTTSMLAVVSGDFKLIYNMGDNLFELYDKKDTHEEINLYDIHRERAEELRNLLMKFMDME